MNIQLLLNGNLEMFFDEDDIPLLKEQFGDSINAESEFVRQYLEPRGYTEIQPEQCGALTSATLITDGKDVWGDMQYQVQSFIEELIKGNKVIWFKG